MVTLQKAIQGVPQDVSNGAALLGITAWHIYPDIIVFNPIKYIHLDDTLVHTGGTITLGLIRNRTDEEEGDINWSVSLSHLRYYGEPVAIERSLSIDTDRITIRDLRCITLGCLFSSWRNASRVDVIEACECLVALGTCLGLPATEGTSYQPEIGWLTPVIIAARDFMLSQDDERDTALYFIEFGMRRGRRFLDDSLQDVTPLFGLLNPYQLFRVSRDFEEWNHEVERQIKVYRQLACDCGFGNDESMIVSLPQVVSRGALHDEDTVFDGHWEIASAVPVPRPTKKHLQDSTFRFVERHTRWIHIDRTFNPALQPLVEHGDVRSYSQSEYPLDEDEEPLNQFLQLNPTACSCKQEKGKCYENCSCRKQGKKCTSLCQCLESFTGIQESLSCSNVRACRMECDAPEEECFWLSFRATMDIDHSTSLQNHQFEWKDAPIAFDSTYKRRDPCPELRDLFSPFSEDQQEKLNTVTVGIPLDRYRINAVRSEVKFRPVHSYDRAALYLTDRSDVNMPQISFSELKSALLNGKISPELLRNHLSYVGRHGVKDYTESLDGVEYTGRMFFRSLNAIAAISELYQHWTGATIKISVTKSPIGAARWAQNLTGETFDLSSKLAGPEHYHTKLSISKMYRATKFACIIMLESGGIDLHPDQLELVMGIATGNSIYAAEYLLQDPTLEDRSGKSSFTGIQRIIGSLGEPGIVCLVPPQTTKRIQLDDTRHRLIRQDVFDGKLTDRFDQSSLHLSLTAWNLKLAVAQGSIDADVSLREALISVFDGSQWIADLDILQGLESPTNMKLSPCLCSEDQARCSPGALGQQLVNGFGPRLKSISRWDELLLCQDNLLSEEVGAVRASGNWYARLAAMALASSIGCPVTILPCGKMCLQCGQRMSSWRPLTPRSGQAPQNLLIM